MVISVCAWDSIETDESLLLTGLALPWAFAIISDPQVNCAALAGPHLPGADQHLGGLVL